MDWGTGLLGSPLLLINTRLTGDSPTYFPSHAPRQPGVERHVSICHMDEAKQVPNWADLVSQVFADYHNRVLWIIPEGPHHAPFDSGMHLDL